MSVLIVTNNFPPKYDGVGDYSFLLYQKLRKAGINTKVITSNQEEIKSCHLENPDFFNDIEKWNIPGCLVLYKFVRKKSIKTVLLQYEPYSFNKYGLPITLIFLILILRISGVNIHVNFHEIAIRLRNANLFNKIRSIFQYFIAYSLCIISNSIQTSNKHYAKILLPFKAAIVPIPSNFEFIQSGRINLENNFTTIAINANRCNSIFFEAIKILTRTTSLKIRVIILGRAYASDISNINNWIQQNNLENHIEFFINQSSDMILFQLKAASVFIQLELVTDEGLGGVSSKSGMTATALFLGIPMITTKGDMTDLKLFQDNINVCFVPYSDIFKLVNTIKRIINDIEFRKNLSDNARSSYLNFFSWHHTIKFTAQLINSHY